MPFILNSKSIDSISGPVFCKIIYPPDQFKHKLPILFLFGDYHKNHDNECLNCSCTTSNCCYKIYTFPFYEELNKLAKTTGKNIDIFLEDYTSKEYRKEVANSTEEKILKIQHESYFEEYQPDHHTYSGMVLMRGNFQFCFNTDLKKLKKQIYDKVCPASNLKWHITDPRLLNIHKNINDPEYSYSKSFRFESYISEFWNIFGPLLFHIELENDLIMNEIIHIKKHYFDDDDQLFFSILHNMLYLNKSPETFITYMFSNDNYAASTESLCLKKIRSFDSKDKEKFIEQINKYYLKYSYGSIMNETSEFYTDIIQKNEATEYLTYDEYLQHINENQDNVISLIENLIQGDIELIKTNIISIRDLTNDVVDENDQLVLVFSWFYSFFQTAYHTWLCSIFFDFHFIAKILKQQDSSLNFSYIGYEHANRISNFFIDNYQYTTIFSSPEFHDSHIDRCITFKHLTLNLDEELA